MSVTMREPQSPPCTKNFSKPSLFISFRKICADCRSPKPDPNKKTRGYQFLVAPGCWGGTVGRKGRREKEEGRDREKGKREVEE